MTCGADVSGEQSRVATSVSPARPATRVGNATQALQRNLLEALRDATLGEYEILAELGRGGMATVFLAHDIQLDRKVAIKVMNPQLVAGEGMVERFKLEARTAAGLSHPHIIPIYAVRQTDDLLYFVMKFIEGRPLDSIIKQSAPLPVPMVRSIVTKVGEALGYAHRRGVVHRDIKPANIMIDIEGMPIVTDFGIAKVADTQGLTMTGATIGTPTYMSPEQCNAQPITGASDQYSLGVMAYEMLTGRPLYDGDSVMTIMFKHVHDAPPAPETLGSQVPRGLAEAITRMLRKAPAERWPSIEDALPFVVGTSLAYDDSVRTQMMQFARAGSQREILDRVSTPRSPIPVAALSGPTESAETVRVASPQQPAPRAKTAAQPPLRPAPAPAPRSRAGLVVGLVAVLVLGVAGALAVLKPWAGPPAGSAPAGTVATAPPVAGPPPPAATVPAETTGTSSPTPASSAPTAAPAAPVAARVQIAGASDLEEGNAVTLTATVFDRRGQPLRAAAVDWESSDVGVATIDRNGLVRGMGDGRATITAAARSAPVRAEAEVTVRGAVRRVEITPAGPHDVPIGESRQLGATVYGTADRVLAGRLIEWTSSDDDVATVTPTGGRVTARGPGTATVTAATSGVVGTVAIRAPARAAPPATPPPGPPPPDPQVAVAELVTQYANALQSRDMSRVLALYPAMQPEQAQELRASLHLMEGLLVSLVADNVVLIDQNRARARVTGRFTYRQRGRDRTLPIDNTYNFERRDGVWMIASIL